MIELIVHENIESMRGIWIESINAQTIESINRSKIESILTHAIASIRRDEIDSISLTNPWICPCPARPRLYRHFKIDLRLRMIIAELKIIKIQIENRFICDVNGRQGSRLAFELLF